MIKLLIWHGSHRGASKWATGCGVNVANQVDFINLNDSAEYWVNHIVHLDTQIDRGAYFYKIKNSAFDIEAEAHKLERIYLEIIK